VTRKRLAPGIRTMWTASFVVVVGLAILLSGVGATAQARAASGTGTISGTVFQDLNRNGVEDAGEAPLASQGMYLLDASGQNQIAYTASDASGHYSFSGVADGNYVVKFDTQSWWAIRHDWVPTTTGSIFPRIAISLVGSATADFGWRPIVRSTDVATPISSYVGSNGLHIDSYDDVVSAKAIYDDLMTGSLIAGEAPNTTVRFDFGDTSYTSTSVSGSAGSYSNYHAVSTVAYISWLDGGDQTLFHEYGHAWSLSYAYIVQQDAKLTAYLTVRGILNDPRLDTSHAWNRNELIAEDYRQLFGSTNAQLAPQENTDLPPAAAVSGLRSFLSTTFMQPPPPTVPTNSSPPTVTGSAVVGQTLTGTSGSWSGNPTSYGYQWERCSSAGTNCSVISGAQASTYLVTSADAGSTLCLVVTASNSAGPATATSSDTPVVTYSFASASFSGTLTKKSQSQSFSLAVGGGPSSASLSFAASSSLTLKVVSSTGATVASASGGSPLTVSPSLGPGTYSYVVSAGRLRADTSFTVSVTYVKP
jgi:hypothetical protein